MAARRPCDGTQSPANSSRGVSFPKKRGRIRGNFLHFLWAPEPVEAEGVSYRGTDQADKMLLSIRFPPIMHSSFPENFQ